MTRADHQVPDESPEKPEREIARDARRAAALRANLKRRKAQLRGRSATENAEAPEPDAAE